MKRLLSVIAFALLATTTLYAQTPVVGPVTPPGAPVQAQRQHRHAGWQRMLNLTPEQRQQLKPMAQAFHQQVRGLRQAQRSQLQSILSPEQLAQMQSMRQANGRLPKGWARSLALTPDQRQQLRALHQQTRSQVQQARRQFLAQVQPVLTPDQQATLNQYLQQHQRQRI